MPVFHENIKVLLSNQWNFGTLLSGENLKTQRFQWRLFFVLIEFLTHHQSVAQVARQFYCSSQSVANWFKDRPYNIFDMHPNQSAKPIHKFLKGYSNNVQCDASKNYDSLFKPQIPDPNHPPPKENGCNAHCRRYFVEAEEGEEAKYSAIIMSVLSSARRHGLNEWEYQQIGKKLLWEKLELLCRHDSDRPCHS